MEKRGEGGGLRPEGGGLESGMEDWEEAHLVNVMTPM